MTVMPPAVVEKTTDLVDTNLIFNGGAAAGVVVHRVYLTLFRKYFFLLSPVLSSWNGKDLDLPIGHGGQQQQQPAERRVSTPI